MKEQLSLRFTFIAAEAFSNITLPCFDIWLVSENIIYNNMVFFQKENFDIN